MDNNCCIDHLKIKYKLTLKKTFSDKTSNGPPFYGKNSTVKLKEKNQIIFHNI